MNQPFDSAYGDKVSIPVDWINLSASTVVSDGDHKPARSNVLPSSKDEPLEYLGKTESMRQPRGSGRKAQGILHRTSTVGLDD